MFARIKTYLFALALLLPISVFAAPGEGTAFNGDFINDILDIVNLLNLMIAMLTAPAAVLAGWLLTPDWTFGDFFGLREYLYEIWILVSNIVYIIFAIILLWMAANGIFHPGDSDYVIKKSLPRFLVGILMVPFTWFIVSFTLTIVNKGIAVVMSIPMGTIVSVAGDDEDSSWNYRIIPTHVKLDFGEEGGAYGTSEAIKCEADGETPNGTPCISPAEFLGNNRSGPFYMIMVYAYDIFKVQNSDFIDQEELCRADQDYEACIRSLTGVLARGMFNIIWALFFSLLLIGLAVVLLYRAFTLWIYIMFSPMFGLAVFFKKQNDTFGEGDFKVGFTQFFKLAVVPLMVAAILSFGLLFIGVIRDNPGSGGATIFGTKESGGAYCTRGTWTVKFCYEHEGGTDYTSYLVIGGESDRDEGRAALNREGAGDYSITLEFGKIFSDLIDEANNGALGEVARGTIGSVQDIFSYAIMNTIALVIIWMGTIAAIKFDPILTKAFEPFKQFGDQVGGMIKALPGRIPIGNSGLRLGGINAAAQSARGAMDESIRGPARQIGSDIGRAVTGREANRLTNELQNFRDSRSTDINNFADRLSRNRDSLDIRNEEQRNLLVDEIQRVDQANNRRLSNEEIEQLKGSRSDEEFRRRLERYMGDDSPIVDALRANTDGLGDTARNTGNALSIAGITDARVQGGRVTADGLDGGVQVRSNNGRLDLSRRSAQNEDTDRLARAIRDDVRRELVDDARINSIEDARTSVRTLQDRYNGSDGFNYLNQQITDIEGNNAIADADKVDRINDLFRQFVRVDGGDAGDAGNAAT